ncbi:cdc42 effector protein 3 [Mastacembelus armatus]|uniref:Cdc42 effector protein 3-like n=1 Tax=Mastacembelus armatus TaxID=205130 RepID=A0A3Q3LAW8_9TELE|nr:cdc42 effector protein 3-like [Mastacembelus armatus]XP_026154390.1 cdc42 effector protein 3-like [Mastacembelus armatus]XP_026154397.1 cdc42 effector protein 3-like [Mastacembelus armatus]XP_033180899.1 cdc42 effector protein 3-like [Mastacembelus armatus]
MPLRTALHRKLSSGHWTGRSSKHREVLSVNTISLPLAFRHISHISSNAHSDSFGDLSFLKMDQNLLLQSSQSEQNLFLACSPPPKPPRLNLDKTQGSVSPDWSVSHQQNTSQKRKKCSSMPLLDSEEGDEETEKQDGYQRGTIVASNQNLSHQRGSVTSDQDTDSTKICNTTARQQTEEDSGFSFNLDLGPSILDDVLQVMDKLHK